MSAQNNALSYTFGHDDLHRLTSKTDTRLGRTLSLEYDPVGNVSRKTDYQGDVTELQHDSTNRVVAMRNAGYLQASYHYDPAGRLLNRILSSGAQTDYAYDAASRLTRLTQRTADGTQLRSVLYTHDRVGNVLTTLDDEGSSTFGYDALYRLTSADHPGTGDDESFTYDPVGNRITSTRAGASRAYAHDADNRLQTVRAGLDPDSGPLLLDLDYDADGNEILRRDGAGATIHSLVYDLKNRLISATSGGQTTDFAYDTGDFRIEEDEPSGRFLSLLEGEHLEAVYDGFGVLKRKYLRGAVIDEVINGYHFDAVGAPTNYTYHHDALQSVVGLSGHAGTIEETLRYRPFGEVRAQAGSSPSLLRFTGRELDVATGLYYYRARYYDPELGRFLTEDPLGFGGGDVNLYAYAASNPINTNDPSGNCPWCIGAAIGGGGELLAQYVESRVAGHEFRPDFGRIGLATAAGVAGVGLASAGARIFQGTSLFAAAGRAAVAAGGELGLGTTQEAILTGQLPSLGQAGFLLVGGGLSSIGGELVGNAVLNSRSSQLKFGEADRLGRIAQSRIDNGLARQSRIDARLNQSAAITRGLDSSSSASSAATGGLISVSSGFANRIFSGEQDSSGGTGSGGFVIYPSRSGASAMGSVYAK